ncbi:MAG TPA: 5-(carboxyamino)imidazole ribonucleotide synthase [Thermomicrobiales bacterium]|nr:5-(carboxyamino)imidazole ribonucleotide synthase [Thermomicrobiales bacterium]
MRRDRADVGFIGAGQLARMSAAPAIALDLRLAVLANHPDDSAAQAIPDVTIGNPDDPAAVEALASHCAVVTFDHELVDTDLLERMEAEGFAMRPSSAVMRLSQSKRMQRERFCALGLPAPHFLIVVDRGQVADFVERHALPLIVKADRGGYDGRGVWTVEDLAALDSVLDELEGRRITPILEEQVPLDRELAMQIARNPSGEMRSYPLVETVQIDGMLRELIAPAPDAGTLQEEARQIVETIAADSGIVGLLAVEFFQSNGKLLINEIATRPHNSGHFSIEGAVTSQFEQHLRAVLDLPLGSTALTAPWAVTENIVGAAPGDLTAEQVARVMAREGVHLHLYGKDARPGRKIGHLTVMGDHLDETLARARAAAAIVNGEGGDA